ncbi:hypothetical protein AGMMS50225_24990 [Betaproteobacteria bacterium]|nr:hypothetical protein AGMMS50225_24990 [Betaproteobacteria bacterium]
MRAFAMHKLSLLRISFALLTAGLLIALPAQAGIESIADTITSTPETIQSETQLLISTGMIEPLVADNTGASERAELQAALKKWETRADPLDRTALTDYYAKDHLGSVRDVLTQTGTQIASYDYDPYGSLINNPTSAPEFGYAGMQYHQPSGLYLTKYRAYDPRTGRWLSRYPIGEAGGLNLYGYVGGIRFRLWIRWGWFVGEM